MLFCHTIRSRWLSTEARTSFTTANLSGVPIAYCLLTIASPSHSFRIEIRLHAAAVALERTLGAGGIGSLEDPVLPGREAAEDLGLHRFGTCEPEVRLHAGKP